MFKNGKSIPNVYIKRYVSTHPTAMLNSSTSCEITKIEGAAYFEIDKHDNDSHSRIVSVGDKISLEHAYEISLDANVIMEPVYPN